MVVNTLIIIVASLLFSAFFSAMEIAFVSANRLKLEIDRKQNPAFGHIFSIFRKRPEQYLTTILVGNNIALVIYSLNMSLLIGMGLKRIGLNGGSILIETVLSAVVIIFLVEFLPKTAVKSNPNLFLRIFALPVYLFYIILYPFARSVTWISSKLLGIMGVPLRDNLYMKNFGRVDLEHLVGEAAGNEYATENDTEIKLFRNTLDLSGLRARDCMTPRVEIEAESIEAPMQELFDRFVRSKYSRIVIYDGSIDNVAGYVHSRSLLTRPADIGSILQPVHFVPGTMPAEQLMGDMIKRRKSLAVVIDEFGGTAGMITLEDIIEEIFGEIEDEHDTSDMTERRIGANELLLSCRLEVGYLNGKYGLGLEESGEYDTLAGCIIRHCGGFPAPGDVVTIGGTRITVLRIKGSRIDLARVELKN